MKNIDDNLVLNEKLPDDIKIFLTTARNKEGISIKNEDIKGLIAESTQLDELIQMAGRVRNGLDELVIIYDFEQPEPWVNEFDYQTDRKCKANVEKVLESYLSDSESAEERSRSISRIEERFPYLRYDYFSSRLLIYSEKIHQHRRAAEGRNFIHYVIRNWNETYYREDFSQQLYGALEFQRWFPYSNIDVRMVREIDCAPEIIRDRLKRYVENSKYWGRAISLEERDCLKAELKEQIVKSPRKACMKLNIDENFVNIKPLLKKIELDIIDLGGK